MQRRFLACLLAVPITLACSNAGPGACGPGTDPVVVTGLNGVLDGSRLAVEIVQLIPETCEETDQRVWMLFEDPGAMITLGPEPSGILSRGGVEVTDDTIFFQSFNVGVRLDYGGDAVGPVLRLTWFTSGVDLGAVECTASPFACVSI